MKKVFFILILFLFSSLVFSAPREIIIIRHADKWVQKNPGPFLSPKGQVRAEKFVVYYLKHFPKPDFIFASNPVTNAKSATTGYSYRPLQTIMPLANQLAKNNHNGYPVNAQYLEKNYADLAKLLLNNPEYQGKVVLICWHHGLAGALAQKLGVMQPLAKWRSGDFDQVYVLHYDHAGYLKRFNILKHQYPVHINPTWAKLASKN